jgi:DNA-binding MarR family transcriptional regulator
MYEVYLKYSCILKDIAEYVGIYYTTVSGAIKKMSGEMKGDIIRPDSEE